MSELVFKILSALIGLIGAVLGIYNYVHARRKEAREQAEKEAAKERDRREWKFYIDFLKASREGLVLMPEDGSDEHRMAESLVAKGMLERLPSGMGYAVPGQQFVIGTGSKNIEN